MLVCYSSTIYIPIFSKQPHSYTEAINATEYHAPLKSKAQHHSGDSLHIVTFDLVIYQSACCCIICQSTYWYSGGWRCTQHFPPSLNWAVLWHLHTEQPTTDIKIKLIKLIKILSSLDVHVLYSSFSTFSELSNALTCKISIQIQNNLPHTHTHTHIYIYIYIYIYNQHSF